MKSIDKDPKGKIDTTLLISGLLLVALSLIMVFSTTSVISKDFYGSETSMVARHIIHTIIGFIACFIMTKIPTNVLYRLSVSAFILSLALLVFVLLPGVGTSAGGAQRWFNFGFIRLQPGELVKITSIIFMSFFITNFYPQMTSFGRGIVQPGLILTVIGGLLLLQPDFGTTVVIASVICIQLAMVTRFTHLFILICTALSSVVLLILTSPYRMKRLISFTDPFQDPSGSGYQLIQSLIAVGSGGFTGVGLGAGQQKLLYLPAAHTDFIFAVISEELGMLGAIFTLTLFIIIAYRGIKTSFAYKADPFRSSLSLGCTLLLVIPAFFNMSVVLGLLPTKGLVLPLVAYGGTAMIVHLILFGILLRLSKVLQSK